MIDPEAVVERARRLGQREGQENCRRPHLDDPEVSLELARQLAHRVATWNVVEMDQPMTMRQFKLVIVKSAISACRGNKTAAARLLDITTKTIHSILHSK